jgi:hypothetical protein
VLAWRDVGDAFALPDTRGVDGLHAPIKIAANNIGPDRTDRDMVV